MKVCETCGKKLRSSEAYTINGIVQCEQCAYPKKEEKIDFSSAVQENRTYAANNSAFNTVPNNTYSADSNNYKPAPVNNAQESTFNQTISNDELHYERLDSVNKINNCRILGIISFILAFLNPLLSILIGLVGKSIGEKLVYIPNSLIASRDEAISYNKKGITISVIILVVGFIISLVSSVIIFLFS